MTFNSRANSPGRLVAGYRAFNPQVTHLNLSQNANDWWRIKDLFTDLEINVQKRARKHKNKIEDKK